MYEIEDSSKDSTAAKTPVCPFCASSSFTSKLFFISCRAFSCAVRPIFSWAHIPFWRSRLVRFSSLESNAANFSLYSLLPQASISSCFAAIASLNSSNSCFCASNYFLIFFGLFSIIRCLSFSSTCLVSSLFCCGENLSVCDFHIGLGSVSTISNLKS